MRGMAVHGLHGDLPAGDLVESGEEAVCPAWLVVAAHGAIAGLEDAVHAVLRRERLVPGAIALVVLDEHIADLEQGAGAQQAAQFRDEFELPGVSRDTGEHCEEQDAPKLPPGRGSTGGVLMTEKGSPGHCCRARAIRPGERSTPSTASNQR